MEILPAGILDLNSLRKLEHACFDKDAWSLFDLIAVLSWPDVVRLKAMDNGNMIGFVAGDMKLTVRASNHGAIALYEKEGYRTIDIWKKYYNDGEDGLVMEKTL